MPDAGCQQIYFKYCSTFDSTDKGNIGPVTDALMNALGTAFTIACPAFPENQRTIFKGHLFVGDTLLGESGMRDHPLTPMADSNQTQGLRAIISGSCSLATQAQLADLIARGTPAYAIDPLRLANGEDIVADALAWALPLVQQGPVVVYATAAAASVKAVQEQLGVERAGSLIEQALAQIAQGLVQQGVRQLIVAGGETSGAIVMALNVHRLRIGPQIDPGVPWTTSLDATPVALALKSGNFGSVDFFTKAWNLLP